MYVVSRYLSRSWKQSFITIRSLSYNSSTDENKPKNWERRTFEQKGEWQSKFKLFASEDFRQGFFVRLMRAPVDLRPEAIRRWWKEKKEEKEIFDQRFIPERHKTLGNDLATAHFILYRGGKVKFRNETEWHFGKEHKLPALYQPDYHLEAVDASDVNIFYEGLLNFVSLKYLKWLSFRNCHNLNDWCLDYISGELQTLEHLDLHNCQNVTERGLACFYRLKQLKFLDVSGIPQNKHFEMTCVLLEETLPNLKIEGVEHII